MTTIMAAFALSAGLVAEATGGRLVSGAPALTFDAVSTDTRTLKAGELFYIPPVPHDSWVVGDEPYVSLHFLGADHYAK